MRKRILIAGCGYVGIALGDLLASHGHTVWGLRRSVEALPDRIRPVPGDLANPHTLPLLPADLDFIFYMVSSDTSTDEGYRTAYVDGFSGLLSTLELQQQQLKRLFFISSTGVYAQQGGEWVDERSPTAPQHDSGRYLLAGEQLALSAPFPATVVRLGGIYGPGRTRLLERVHRGVEVCLEGRVIYTNRIHREDCAAILCHLIHLPQPDPIYVAVDCEPTDRCHLLHWLAAELGVPPPQRAAPLPTDSRMLRSNKRCRNARLVQTGYQFIYPSYREGYKDLIAAYIRSKIPRSL